MLGCRGCDSTNSELLFAQFDIEHDARYNTYRLCNKVRTTNETKRPFFIHTTNRALVNATVICNRVNLWAKKMLATMVIGCLCQPVHSKTPNAKQRCFQRCFVGFCRCAKGFPLGTNNCTWSASYKLVHVITMDCFRTIASPNYPNGCSRTSW